jgi:hypothetical protein
MLSFPYYYKFVGHTTRVARKEQGMEIEPVIMAASKNLLYIDDAGDPGFKFKHGSSDFFAMSCVLFEDALDAEEVSVVIKRLRRNLGWHDTHEFKFHQTNLQIRSGFFAAVQKYNFKISYILIDKTKITDTELTNSAKLYNYAILRAMAVPDWKFNNASVHIDGKSGRNYQKTLRPYFRQNMPVGAIGKISFVNSTSNNLIQLADMVAGAVLHTTKKNRTDHDVYLPIIAKHIVNKTIE